MLTEQEKQFLLALARNVFEGKESSIDYIPNSLEEKGATFISLYKQNALVHSIGTMIPIKEIFQDVIDNAIILSQEMNDSKCSIEISLLRNMKIINGESEEAVLSQIIPHKHGVVVHKQKKIATLLPVVWNQIQDKREFLEQVCKKLQLDKDTWKKNAEIMIYETETFRETN